MASEIRSSSIEKCILDIAECPICNEVLQNNRCLPCLHMFCLKCLDSYRKGKPKGKPLTCPVCRREFSIPKSSADLPRNFFIDKLLDAHKIKKQDVLPKICEICSDDMSSEVPKWRTTISHPREHTKVVLAERYCCDCRQYICLHCERQHKKIKAIAMHKIIDSKTVTNPEELSPNLAYCFAHPMKEAEVYCQDCTMVICWQCKALSHSSHASLDVISATKDLAAKLEKHIEKIAGHLHTNEAQVRELTECQKLYTDKIEFESAKISREQRRLCRDITDNGDQLKKAISSSASVHLNAVGALRNKLNTDAAELNKQKVYIEQMIQQGNVSDLSEYSNTLMLKTATFADEHPWEIIVPPVASISVADLRNLLTEERRDIDSEDSSKCKGWSVKRTIIGPENGRTVCGITVLYSVVYVVFQDCSTILVYSATQLVLLKNITVDRLVNPNDIVSCKFNNYLYICDWGIIPCIFRVNIIEEMEQINWSTDKDIGCMSVTTEHTVLLAGYNVMSGKLKEYTPNGELVRTIELRDSVKPWHAIRLVCPNTQYLICEGNDTSAFHRVCLIDQDGRVLNSFGGEKGSDEEHLCGPYHLAIDSDGFILVNDCNNSRILLLSPSMKFIKELIPSSANVRYCIRQGEFTKTK